MDPPTTLYEDPPTSLYDDIEMQLVDDDMKRLKSLLKKNPIPPRTLQGCTSISDICEQLVEHGQIRPGKNDFEFLKKQFRQMKKKTIVDIIIKHENKQKKLKTQAASMEHSPTGKNRNDGRRVTRYMTEQSKQAETGAQALTPVQNTMCAISDDGLGSDQRVQEDNKERNKMKLHADLSVELKRIILPDQLTSLIMYVQAYLGHGELDGIQTFDDLWRELNNLYVISPGRYNILERALEQIHPSHLQIIQAFKEKIKNEAGRDERWIKEPIIVKSVAELEDLKEEYRGLLENRARDRHGVVFLNAGISLIGVEGGEIPLRSPKGSATLEVPYEAVDSDHLFWMFSCQEGEPHFPQEREPQFYLSRAAIEPFEDSGIVKYSLPVRLGPSGLDLKGPARLTLTPFRKPTTKKTMSVYRNTDGEHAGSCFFDRDRNDNCTATVALNHFSGYTMRRKDRKRRSTR